MGKRGSTMITIGPKEGDHVVVEAMARVEGGWRAANVSVRCGVWSGHFAAQFLRGELAKFGKEIEYLCEDPKRPAQLRGGEHYLELKLVDEGHGRVRATGHAQERLGSKTALEFEFELERGSLSEMARAFIEAESAE